jgi:hypothetical protein
MNNFIDTYLDRSHRVATLLAWLDCELTNHEARAMKPENAQNWALVGNLTHIEELLKAPLCFLSLMSENEINQALNEGGTDND